MNLFNRIKVRIKSRSAGSQRHIPAPPIEVREKEVFICKNCRNHYNSHFWYCPQCLGEVQPLQPSSSELRIVSIPETQLGELEAVLQALSGIKEYEYQKAFRSLPWIMIAQTDRSILQHWREVLLAEKVEAEIQPNSDQKKKLSRRVKLPIFKSGAPLPFFLSPATQSEVRAVSKVLQDPLIRMKWVEAVLIGHRIVESFYKRNPGSRILFSDFLFQIDQDLHDCCRDYYTYYRAREDELGTAVEKLKNRFAGMEAEILEIRKQVESQL
jgi:hypothetical protein